MTAAPRPITLQPCVARVVQRVVEGETRAAIANAEGITIATVKTYINRASRKIPGPEPARIKFTLWVYGLRREVIA